MSLADEVRSGDLRRALVALRDHLTERLAGVEDDEKVAPVARQLTEVLVRLDALAVPEGSKLDELAAARRKRRTGS